MADPRVQTFLAGLDLAVEDVQAHPLLCDGARGRLVWLHQAKEATALAAAATDLGTKLALQEMDPPPSPLINLVCVAARLRHCRTHSYAHSQPVVVERSAVRETVDQAATRISLRADAVMLDLVERRGLSHYVRQAELAAMHAVRAIDGTAPGGPASAIAAFGDAMDFALVALASSRACYLPPVGTTF